MSINRIAALTLAAASAAFAQELPTQKLLTIELAQTIAQEAMAKCRADGYKVTVTVVDHANMRKAFLRDAGSSGQPACRRPCAAAHYARHHLCRGRRAD